MNIYINNFHLPKKNFYTSEWILYIFKKYFLETNLNIRYDNNLKKNRCYVFIENFDDKSVEKIIKAKKKNKIKIIIILTEFFGHRQLNQDILEKSYITFVFDFVNILKNFWLLKIIKKNIFLKKIFFKVFKKNILNRSFQRRFRNLEKIIPYTDLIFTTHPEISKQFEKRYKKKTILMFPKLNLIKPKKKFLKKIKFTGEMTQFRKNLLQDLSDKIQFNHSSHKFIINNSNKFIYSIHPAKNSTWIYSSPIRYFMSIYKNEIPIIINNFNDNFSNFLSIKCYAADVYNLFENYKKNLQLLNSKINNYNNKISSNKKKNFKRIIKILKNKY